MNTLAGVPGSRPGRLPSRAAMQASAGRLLPAFAFGGLALLVYRYDAPPVLGGALLLACAVGLVLRPEVATQLAVFVLYLNLPAIAHKYHGVPQPIAGAFLVLLCIPLGHYLVLRRQKVRVDASFRLMLAFFAVLLLASLRARGPEAAAERIQTFLLEGVVLYWLVVNAIRDLPALRRAIWTLIAAGSLLGGLSLFQEVTGSFDQQFGGLARRNYEYMVLEEKLAADPDNVELRERKDAMRDDRSRRAEGPMDEPNMYAQIMLALLPLTLFTFRAAAGRPARMLAAVAAGLIVGGMVVAESRGAFVALVLVVGAALAIRWIRPAHVVTCALALGGLATLVASERLVERLATIPAALAVLQGHPSVQRDYAIEGRATEMLAALQVFGDHPLLGVGPGQYAPFYSVEYHQKNPRTKFLDLRIPRRGHSLYLEMGAEVGAVGLSVFLAIVGVLMRSLWLARKHWLERSPLHADLATALLLTLGAYLATGIFLHLMYERYYWLLLALASAGVHILRELEHAPAREHPLLKG
ncbi:MAG TPA: O-antigen ligase family protein [Longimicrobiaceae bacterium]